MNEKEPKFDIDTGDFIIGNNGDIVFTDKVKFQNGCNGVTIQKGTFIYNMDIGIDYDELAKKGSNEYVFKLFEHFIRKQYQDEGLDVTNITANSIKYPFFNVDVEYIAENSIKVQNFQFNIL